MTTYQYTVRLNDSECIMLAEALRFMVEHCAHEIESGSGAPYLEMKDSAEAVLSRLYGDMVQTSGA